VWGSSAPVGGEELDARTDGFVDEVASTEVEIDGEAVDDCVGEVLAVVVAEAEEPVELVEADTDTDVDTLGLVDEQTGVCSVCTNGALSGARIDPVTV
jgi:hypothetical protein